MKKRLLSALLTFCMVLTMLPVSALAADPARGSDTKTAEENGVVVNKTVNYDGSGSYSLTMEAYVTNEVTTTQTTKPLDIVLVLDVSGSMDQSITSYTYEATSRRNWSYDSIGSRTQYYYYDGTSYYTVQRERSNRYWDRDEHELVRDYSLYYVDDSGSRHYLGNETRSEDATILEDTVLYTRSNGGSIPKMTAMKNAVGNFIDQVAANAAGDPTITEDDVTHRISIVKFAGDSTNSIGNDTYYDWPYTYNYSQVVKDLTEVSGNNIQELKSTVNSLDASGATLVNYGLNHAQRVLTGGNGQLTGAREDAKKVVVVFTDGNPTSGSSWEGRVAASAVNLANGLKDGGVTVYTIGMFGNANPSDTNSDFNKYMNGVSSNYPNAKVTDWQGNPSQDWDNCTLGTRVAEDENYYFAAANASDLDDAFDTIADNESTSKVTAGSDTVLSDTLSEFFTFPEGLTGTSQGVTVQYAEVTGKDQSGEYTWGDLQPLDDVTPVIDAGSKTITVKGFDYTGHAVTETTDQDGTVSWSGGKLVLTFPIKPDVNGSWSDAETYVTNDTGDKKAGLSGFTVDKKPDQSLKLEESPVAPVETYSVTYDKNASEATGTVTDTKYYITGGEATVLGNGFTWTGHEFTGWNTAANGTGTAYKAGDTITIENADVTLYAQWRSTAATYTVEHYQEALDGTYKLYETERDTGNVGETATATPKDYTGFHYNEEAEGSVPSGPITEDSSLVLKLYYDRNECTVTYEYENGIGSEGDPIDVPENAPNLPGQMTYKYGQVVKVADEPTLDGYDFYGWYSTQPDINSDMQDGTITIPAYDVVIKGAFTQHTAGTYTVTYDLNGGTISDGSPLQYPGLQMGETTPTIPAPTKTDDEYYSYTFTGWDPEFSATVTGNVTYVAQYERTPITYTVTYKLDGIIVDPVEEYRYGADIQVRPQAEGATEWNTTDLDAGDITAGWFYMPNHNVVFTATTDGTVTPSDCTYTVVYHYVARDGSEATQTDPADAPSTANTPVSGLYDTNRTTYENSTYIFDRAELNRSLIYGYNDVEILVPGHNTIDVYYDIDELGPDDGPDEVPDKDQIVFTYVSADSFMGSVSLDKEVVTRNEKTGMASPTGAAATANESYEFVQWTDSYYGSTDTDAEMESLAALFYSEDTTFTAYFQKAGEEATDTISVTFLAENGTFSNGQTTYTATVEASKVNDKDVYLLASDDLLEATPDTGYSYPTWTLNYEDCDAPHIGDPVADWDLFVVTFHPVEVIPTQIEVIYEWDGEAPENIDLPNPETVDSGSDYVIQQLTSNRVETSAGTWYFLGWYDDNTPCGSVIDDIQEDTTLYGRWIFQPVSVDQRFLVTKVAEKDSVTVGETIHWTITIENLTDGTLNLKVEDLLNGCVLTDQSGNPVEDTVTVAGRATVILNASYETKLADAGAMIRNTVVVTDTGNPDEPPVEVPADPVEVEPYAITITPADIVIYTGGTGYSGVLDEDDSLVSSTEQGLPEPGYHIDLPDSVETWLTNHGVDLSQAAHLANYLHFYYYDQDTGAAIRRWDLMDQGIYSRDAEGNVTAYVYSLSPNMIPGEYEGVKVRLQFTDDGNIVTTDNIRMEESVVSASYEMTIYGDGLNQSEIQAVFSVGDDTLICNVDIGTGHLLIKSVTDESTSTNEIVDSADTVDFNQITAVDGGDVTYYVNNSEVEVGSDRVQLLVDSVSNNTEFNRSMEQDAINKADAQDGVSLSDAQAESFYLDLVDTDNGNTVVTLGDDDKLTIYWPMPDDADENGEFYIVHYDEMDRTQVSSLQSDPEIIEVTRDGDHLVFQVGSFSPFVLVYEKDDGGSHSGGGGGGSSNDDDDDDDDKPELNKEDHIAYVSGYPDGTVQPEGYITREEVATIFFRLLTDSSRADFITEYNPYPDVEYGRWSYYAITTMTNGDLMLGRPGGVFDPGANITRAEFAVVASLFSNAQYSGPDQFTDISEHWARDYINRAAAEGWVAGYPDGTFGPDRFITRAEVMALVNEVLERAPDADYMLEDMTVWPDNPESAWYYEDVQEATNSHAYVWRNSQHTSEDWEDFIPMRTFDELVRDAFLAS